MNQYIENKLKSGFYTRTLYNSNPQYIISNEVLKSKIKPIPGLWFVLSGRAYNLGCMTYNPDRKVFIGLTDAEHLIVIKQLSRFTIQIEHM